MTDGSRLLITFDEHLRATATDHWRGSPSFPDRIVRALGRHRPVLDAMWRLGGLDLDRLAESVGTELCGIDAKRARGEYTGPSGNPGELEPPDDAVAAYVLREEGWLP